jgi:4-hydroxy-tetrahydrodipicolinate synthase
VSAAYPGGVWPVMLTPYTRAGEVDVDALSALTDWYIKNGASGLFAACQSSEIYKLSLEERVLITKTTRAAANGRVPVIASGHVSDDMDAQVRELTAIAETGVDAVVLITNHFAREDEGEDIWLGNLETLLGRIDPAVRLGAYECPAPYKRLLTDGMLRFMAGSGRFYFLKDTCCDAEMIRGRLEVLKGSNLKLYNANSATLLDSLRAGAHGFSGVMANMHPQLYAWLTANPAHKNADFVQAAIAVGALIERQLYPVCAKYHLAAIEKLPMTTFSRAQDDAQLTQTLKAEVHALDTVMRDIYARYCV